MIVVYGKNSGVATTATYFGNQWWITSKDERLEPLYSGEPYDQSDYRFLCEKGSLILMKDIAGMMGCAMECGEIDTREVLKNRLRDLNGGAEEPPQGSECAGCEVPGCASGYESGAACEDEGGWLLREL